MCASERATTAVWADRSEASLRVGDADENDEPVAETRLVAPAHAGAAQYDKDREPYSKAHGGG